MSFLRKSLLIIITTMLIEVFSPDKNGESYEQGRKAQDLPSSEDDSIVLVRTIAYQIIGPFIVAFGILGNILTIVILRTHLFKGVTSKYFLALAISDLLALLFSISGLVHLLNPLTPHESTAVWYSYFESLFISVPMITSVYIVMCITLDRYFSTCKPLVFKKIHTDMYCNVGILCSFCLAFLLSLPLSFVKEPSQVEDCDYVEYNNSEVSNYWLSCEIVNQHDDLWYAVYSWGREILVSFFPIIVLVILNITIIRKLIEASKKRKQMRASRLDDTDSDLSPNDKMLIKLLNGIIILFVVTILPSGIFNALYTQSRTTDLSKEIFQALANDLELLNHALNFYLYVILSKPVRSALPKMLKRLKEKLKEGTFFLKCQKKFGKQPNATNKDPSTSGEELPQKVANQGDCLPRSPITDGVVRKEGEHSRGSSDGYENTIFVHMNRY